MTAPESITQAKRQAAVSQFNAHHGTPESREVRWLTPKSIPAALGRFDLDPCGAPGWDLADQTYLLEAEEDGLKDRWFGRVWLNPPYGAQAEAWVERLANHGMGTALLFARTETAMFHRLVWPRATAVMFLKGRVTFHDAEGTRAGTNAGAPSVLVAYGAFDALQLVKAERKSGGQMGRVLTTAGLV